MPLHDLTDPQIDALRTLLKPAINTALQPATTEEVIVEAFGWPISTARVPQLRLPILAIWRQQDQLLEHTVQHDEDERATIRFDYVASATPLELIDHRWPVLRAVWRALLDVLSDTANAATLIAAGFVEVDLSTARVQYLVPGDQQAVYPSFQGTIQVVHRAPAEDLDALPDLSLETQIRPPDLPADEQPLVAEIHEP